jgi:hypothetical protein
MYQLCIIVLYTKSALYWGKTIHFKIYGQEYFGGEQGIILLGASW